jgi:hypothetical protein
MSTAIFYIKQNALLAILEINLGVIIKTLIELKVNFFLLFLINMKLGLVILDIKLYMI